MHIEFRQKCGVFVFLANRQFTALSIWKESYSQSSVSGYCSVLTDVFIKAMTNYLDSW